MMLSFEASQSCKCSDAIVVEARRVAVAVSRGDEGFDAFPEWDNRCGAERKRYKVQ